MTSNEKKMKKFAEVYNDVASYPTLSDVAHEMGIAVQTVKNRAAELRRRADSGKKDTPELISRAKKNEREYGPGMMDFVIKTEVPDKDEDINDLIARVKKHNRRVRDHFSSKDMIDIKIKAKGPIGVVGLPDQHLNNVGTHLSEALSDAEKIQDTEGLYCIAVGDWLDNFIIGRLERERRKDIMSHRDAVRLQEHYVCMIAPKLLAAVGGNHNDWPAMLGGEDQLAYLFNSLGLKSIYDPDQVRVRLTTPSGAQFIHLCRHIFPGHSKYHPTHGILVWMLERWGGEDVFWGGHIHTSGHMVLTRDWMGKRKNVRGIQLSSYKKIDDFAMKKGFRPCDPFTSPMVIHDPDTGRTTFYEDIDEGIEILKYKRSKART